ncbi:MAG TPA: DUF3618 domain-containing protein [Intrasporangium sp.]|uniref:DUF3618 domain-containing protein n=1 Tax=Intrasporangium sp. TaxID=1925024 RepID=UPI002B4876E5|nr:DUF3618 domain-containing protein [Intrasporangium sp.]HKX65780.1 DUF3618 domain-containing protein [Intrasporangium sp.]
MTDTARIERDIEAARARLEGTVNELAYRAQPQVMVQRQVQSLALRINEATHTPDGDLRVERIAAVAGAVVAFVVVVGLLRRRRHR